MVYRTVTDRIQRQIFSLVMRTPIPIRNALCPLQLPACRWGGFPSRCHTINPDHFSHWDRGEETHTTAKRWTRENTSRRRSRLPGSKVLPVRGAGRGCSNFPPSNGQTAVGSGLSPSAHFHFSSP